MSALTKGRNTPRAQGKNWEYPVLAATKCFAGGLAVLNAAGWAVPGATATTLVAVGRFEADADNSAGANGDIKAKIRTGTFLYANSAAADEITQAEIGDVCYIVDDQTVAKTDGTSTRSLAGKIMNVDAQGVWVAIGIIS